MKKISFVIALFGIFILLIILNLSPAINIANSSNLSKLMENTKVQVQGKVIEERTLYEDAKLIKLENEIEIICENCPNYLNQTIKVVGIVDKYENKTQIRALKIEKIE